MVNFKKLADKAKGAVDKRGGVGSLKEDAEELRNIAKGKGSFKDKAKEAAEAVKDPGAKGPGQPREKAAHRAEQGRHPQKPAPGARPEADEPSTRSK